MRRAKKLEYGKGDWVVLFNGGVVRWPTQFRVERRATQAEVEVKLAEIAEREQAQRARLEREARQDWKDATYVAGWLEHDRERAIAVLGDLLANAAARLRGEDADGRRC